MDNEETLEKLKKILPEENFKIQPKTALENMRQLEHKYGVSTDDFMDMNVDDSHITEEDIESWISNYETYLAFSNPTK